MKPLFRETQNKKFIEVIGHYDNPILCAKLTLLADLYAVEHREGYALFKTEDYDKLSKIDDKLEYSITDLTGYTWVGNNNISRPIEESSLVYSINFTCSTNNFETLGFPPTAFSDTMYYTGSSASTIMVYSFAGTGSWTDDTYKTITFTGGTDSTNATLIAWLEANGTLTAPQPEPEPTSTDTLFLGNLSIDNIYFGAGIVSKIYFGNELVYEKYSPSIDNALLTSEGNYYLVKSDSGKHIRIKGDDRVYSEATELKDKPREYEEVEE